MAEKSAVTLALTNWLANGQARSKRGGRRHGSLAALRFAFISPFLSLSLCRRAPGWRLRRLANGRAATQAPRAPSAPPAVLRCCCHQLRHCPFFVFLPALATTAACCFSSRSPPLCTASLSVLSPMPVSSPPALLPRLASMTRCYFFCALASALYGSVCSCSPFQ